MPPSLDEVLALRADRMATVRQVFADLTDEKLAGTTEPVMEPGYPASESFAVETSTFSLRELDVLEVVIGVSGEKTSSS